MQIDYIICPDNIEEKLAKKHHVTLREARQTLLNEPRIRFAEADAIYRFSSSSNPAKILRL